MKNKLMAHVVAGYPSEEDCIELMLGMEELGVGIIEVQIPFSDPIADGETIMRANDVALDGGMDTKSSFDMLRKARSRGLAAEIYIMSYIQKLNSLGMETFCENAARAGAKGLIVPDLPFDSPEYKALLKTTNKHSLELVPVVSPGMSEKRLSGALNDSPGLVYLTSIKGITGSKLQAGSELDELCKQIRRLAPQAELAVGFGVRDAKDVKQMLKMADMVVVGSAVIRRIKSSGVRGGLELIKQLVG
ncbi:MAG TPA: tryptophan synthase subunit alpha [Candidatus Saccharimonadales bacterium]|nr:tryptophan synthase subunit alpha [Candidatus Saccharimonadales bacterium]